jgi:hypothetical protein
LGTAAGKIAAFAGVKGEGAAPRTEGRFPKKNKSRLPRRQKKAARKQSSVSG